MEREIEQDEAARLVPRQWKQGQKRPGSRTEARKVPEFVPIAASSDRMSLVGPGKDAEPLPDSVKDILLATRAPPTQYKSLPWNNSIDILCHINRIYVRVQRELFASPDAYSYLKFGSCHVNQATDSHFYLLYPLMTCGTVITSHADRVTFTNRISYKRDSTGPIVRDFNFDVPLECSYNRFHLSYKVGFWPTVRGGTVFRPLTSRTWVTLTPYDVHGTELTPGIGYTLGQPMFFEATLDSALAQKPVRVYVNKCFMTISPLLTSVPQYTVIENTGCMVDGRYSEQSQFISHATKTVLKFTIGSFIFEGMSKTSTPKELYMHCDISVGDVTPTESAKSCNYNPGSKTWTELYGDNAVCFCCDSVCPPPQPASQMITSHSWNVDDPRCTLPSCTHPQSPSLPHPQHPQSPSHPQHPQSPSHPQHPSHPQS
ncbi:zona pellucida sperm-binding protein 3-like, partial [Osmerus mordax]|uniref:zona pellucida sperm-binding protein 3-like n=1 Tax=Osmerus mordax TaxID=8014 RepID=UPI00350F8D5C